MAAANSTETDVAKQLVFRHLQQHFSLNPGQVDILDLTLADLLPGGAHSFSVREHDVLDGNEYYYIVIDGRVYCNHVAGDFVRLLRDYRYFEKLDWNASQMLLIYQHFEIPRAASYPVTETVLKDSPSLYAAYPQVTPPVLTQSRGGLTLTFYMSTIGREAPVKWTVTISPDYHVEAHQDEPLQPR